MNEKKIGDIMLFGSLSQQEFEAMLQDTNMIIYTGISDNLGRQTEVNIAEDLRNENEIGEAFKKIYYFCNYHLNKDKVILTVTNTENSFELKASQLTDVLNNSEPVNTHKVTLLITTSTGNPIGELTKTQEYLIDVADDISQATVDELAACGIILEGEKWSAFTLGGNAHVVFKKVSQETILVGNKLDGFLIS
jgi:hypothetical protein